MTLTYSRFSRLATPTYKRPEPKGTLALASIRNTLSVLPNCVPWTRARQPPEAPKLPVTTVG